MALEGAIRRDPSRTSPGMAPIMATKSAKMAR